MSIPVAGEWIWFYHYETDHFVKYSAVGRSFEAIEHGEANLTWYKDDDGSADATQANNVLNIEDTALGATEDHWARRFSQFDLSWLTGRLETVRVEKGDMCLFRPWDAVTHWKGATLGVCNSTLGSPSNPHPSIIIKYVNAAGSTVTTSVDAIEDFTSEDAAEGNDLWSNIPSELLT